MKLFDAIRRGAAAPDPDEPGVSGLELEYSGAKTAAAASFLQFVGSLIALLSLRSAVRLERATHDVYDDPSDVVPGETVDEHPVDPQAADEPEMSDRAAAALLDLADIDRELREPFRVVDRG